MLPGLFIRKLQKLNPRLKVWVQDDSRQAAGLYHVQNGEYEPVCGIDKNCVPEHIIYKEDGSILKSGWRRVLKILINEGLIDRFHAQKVFGTHLYYKSPHKSQLSQPSIEKIQAKWR